MTHDPKCFCDICKNHRDFVLPEHLVEAVKGRAAVVFAGAGISTESRSIFPMTVYEEVCIANQTHPKDGPSFPEAMSRFCGVPDGRRKLAELITRRFQYLHDFPELYHFCSRFHRELSTIWHFSEIITTNWDDLFERECGAMPFVTDADFALWEMSGRKVLKVHGSVNNLGTIVATTEDYKRSKKELSQGTVGAILRTMLATKTVIFVGYSLTDFDFRHVYDSVTRRMLGHKPHGYVVTLDENACESIRELGMTPIVTDGTYFLTALKKRLVADGDLMADERFNEVPRLLDKLYRIHCELFENWPASRHPEMIHAAAYQDGLQHALERIMSQRKTGEYSQECKLMRKVQAYESLRKAKLGEKRYADVAYIEGYKNGLLYLTADDTMRKEIPMYFVFGLTDQPKTFTAFKRAAKQAESLHAAAFREAIRLMKLYHADQQGVAVHHPPFLL